MQYTGFNQTVELKTKLSFFEVRFIIREDLAQNPSLTGIPCILHKISQCGVLRIRFLKYFRLIRNQIISFNFFFCRRLKVYYWLSSKEEGLKYFGLQNKGQVYAKGMSKQTANHGV